MSLPTWLKRNLDKLSPKKRVSYYRRAVRLLSDHPGLTEEEEKTVRALANYAFFRNEVLKMTNFMDDALELSSTPLKELKGVENASRIAALETRALCDRIRAQLPEEYRW